ncbi:beta/gamma crystallin domain-containing protein [Oxalobacteraceae bacterium R-40]|uniref:Beta/gamma crystallin domain-containing protein n=1 Tax=Keguizhuia sedimenti TaxID=3064264 RepID=A0ABU1BRY3_9BURK|nr:beta/gamma crystallin domain-containing protein [Oxalobacteraceae bacterium R-40]
MNTLIKSFSLVAAVLFFFATFSATAQPDRKGQDVSSDHFSKDQGGMATPAIPGAPVSADVSATPEDSRKVKKVGQLPHNALLPGNPEVTYVITPPASADGDVPIVRGCWAKLYDEDGLKGDSVTIYGPIGIADAAGAGVFDIDWKDRISSLLVGPAARVFIYDNNNYRDLLLAARAGQKIDINNALKGFDEIKSLKVECAKKTMRNNAASANAPKNNK